MYLIKHKYSNPWYKNSISDLIDNVFSFNLDNINYEEAENISNYDIKDNSKDYRIFLDLPGFDKKEININLDDSRLIIEGKRVSDPGESYIYRNRKSGNFYNSFNLPNHIDRDKISANFKNGVLEVVLPKSKSEIKKASKILID